MPCESDQTPRAIIADSFFLSFRGEPPHSTSAVMFSVKSFAEGNGRQEQTICLRVGSGCHARLVRRVVDDSGHQSLSRDKKRKPLWQSSRPLPQGRAVRPWPTTNRRAPTRCGKRRANHGATLRHEDPSMCRGILDRDTLAAAPSVVGGRWVVVLGSAPTQSAIAASGRLKANQS